METSDLVDRFRRIRQFTEELCEPLELEDYGIQSMPDASPAKWHLAHTTWFFETFVVKGAAPSFSPFHPRFEALFNSYYNSVGEPFPRARRGLLSRPTLEEIRAYRRHVNGEMERLLESSPPSLTSALVDVINLGLNHEQQHQELILTDLKHLLSQNPLRPVYREARETPAGALPALEWLDHAGGLCEIGHSAEGFAFDNEGPRHRVYLEPFQLASRPITCGEYRDFIEDGGYSRPELWLSDGWEAVKIEEWTAPLYWERREGGWSLFTLSGLRPLDEREPVCHVSYLEADAFARWAGARLPVEAEWEVVAGEAAVEGNFVETGWFHPTPSRPSRGPADSEARLPSQLYGDVWVWTRSPHTAYPGYRPVEGALGEYNGKFMSGQMVLRGGSCASPRSHLRPTYRNFFPPGARWQFTGIRLAREGK